MNIASTDWTTFTLGSFSKVIIALILTLLLITPTYSQENSPELLLTLATNKKSFTLDESIWINSKITNISEHTIALPKYILWDEMKLKREGDKTQIITSDGALIKNREDFIILEPRESHKNRFDLTKVQDFRLSHGTWYFQTIEAYETPSGLHPKGWTGDLESNVVTFNIDSDRE